MRYLPFLLLATPALAHDGVHLHPHGFEALLVLGTLGVVVFAALRR